jgi:hypothetical protein
MKTEISDSDYSVDITITPETPEETAILLRLALNANSEKPNVFMSFRNKPYCSVWIKKRKLSVQKCSINPQTK